MEDTIFYQRLRYEDEIKVVNGGEMDGINAMYPLL